LHGSTINLWLLANSISLHLTLIFINLSPCLWSPCLVAIADLVDSSKITVSVVVNPTEPSSGTGSVLLTPNLRVWCGLLLGDRLGDKFFDPGNDLHQFCTLKSEKIVKLFYNSFKLWLQIGLLNDKELLGTNYAARSANPDPGHTFGCRETIMLHHVAGNQGSCATKTSWKVPILKYGPVMVLHMKPTFTVHGNRTWCLLDQFQELENDGIRWATAVHKEQVVVTETGLGEPVRLVDLSVQPNHIGHVLFPEIVEVGFGTVSRVTCRNFRLVWSKKSG